MDPATTEEAATFRPLLASMLMGGAEVLLPAAQAAEAGLPVTGDAPVVLTVERVEVIWRLHVVKDGTDAAVVDLPMGARPMARGARHRAGRPLPVPNPLDPAANAQDLGYERYDG